MVLVLRWWGGGGSGISVGPTLKKYCISYERRAEFNNVFIKQDNILRNHF